MPVTFDAVGAGSSTSGSTGGQTMSWSHTGAGADLVVLVGVTAAKTSSFGVGGTRTCTYGGVPMTSLGTQAPVNGNGWVELFGLVGAPTGPQTVAWSSNQSASTVSFVGQSVSYNGAGSFGSPVGATGPSSNPSVTVPSSVTNMVAAFFRAAANMSAPTQTQRSLNNSGGRLLVQDALGAPQVTLAATMSSSGNWDAIGVDIVTASTPTVSAESATVSDGGGVAANRPDADGGAAEDAFTVAARLPSTEVAAVTETQRIMVGSSDTAQATETNAVNVPIPSTDAGVGSESANTTSKTGATDLVAVVDSGVVAARFQAADTAGHADVGVVRAFIQSADSAAWLEAFGAITAASSSDSGVVVDSGGVVLPGYQTTPKRTWSIPAAPRVTVMVREDRTWRVPRGEHSYKPAPGTAPYTLPFTLTA